MKERKQFVVPVLVATLFAFLIYYVLTAATPGLLALAEQTHFSFTLGEQTAGADAGNIAMNLIYSFTDFAEGPFFVDTVGAICMLAFGFLGYYLEKIHSPLAGTSCGAKTWVWLVVSQFVAMVLANIFWRFVVGWEGWLPTFTPEVSVTPIAILMFGKPNWKKALTGILLGATLPVFMSQMAILYFQTPLGLPLFAALGIAMPIATVIGTEIFKLLPWMNKDDASDEEVALPEEPDSPSFAAEKKSAGYLVWTRCFGGDVSELYFWGGSLSGLGLFLGCIAGFILNPNASACGANLPVFLFTFIFSSAVGMLFWGPGYQKNGYEFTFEGNLMAAALVGTFSDMKLVVIICVVCALIGAPLMKALLKTSFFKRYAACVPVQFFAALTTIAGTYLLRLFVA